MPDAHSYPYGSREFITVNLTLAADGGQPTPYLGAFDVTLVPWGTPTTALTGWAAAATLSGKRGAWTTGLTVGTWVLWARVTDNPEQPLLCCCTITIW